MKENLSEQEEVSTRRSRRARKRVQDSNFVFIWFWIPDLQKVYLLARHVQRTLDEDKHENQMFSLSLVYCFFFLLSSFRFPANNKQSTLWCYLCARMSEFLYLGLRAPQQTFWGLLYSKIILGLQATKRLGSGLHGKHFRAPGLRPTPHWDPVI